MPVAKSFALSHLFTAWTTRPSDLPVRGRHVFGRRGPPSPQGVPADVPQPAATQRPGGPHHIRAHGSGSRAQLRGDRQELRVQGHQGPLLQTDPGGWGQRMRQTNRLMFKHRKRNDKACSYKNSVSSWVSLNCLLELYSSRK